MDVSVLFADKIYVLTCNSTISSVVYSGVKIAFCLLTRGEMDYGTIYKEFLCIVIKVGLTLKVN